MLHPKTLFGSWDSKHFASILKDLEEHFLPHSPHCTSPVTYFMETRSDHMRLIMVFKICVLEELHFHGYADKLRLRPWLLHIVTLWFILMFMPTFRRKTEDQRHWLLDSALHSRKFNIVLLIGITRHRPRGLRNGDTQVLGRKIWRIMVRRVIPFCSSKGKDVSENTLPPGATGIFLPDSWVIPTPALQHRDWHQFHSTKARLPLHLPESILKNWFYVANLKDTLKSVEPLILFI